MTESWHRSEGKGGHTGAVCTVQTLLEKGGQGLVFSLSRFLTATKVTELLSGLSLNNRKNLYRCLFYEQRGKQWKQKRTSSSDLQGCAGGRGTGRGQTQPKVRRARLQKGTRLL